MITPEEFKQKMIEIKELDRETAKEKYGDNYFSTVEDNHRYADWLMCEVLTELGYGEGVEIFEDMERWYS